MQFRVERPLVIIVGPTAVGKTDLAVEVAENLKGVIISADSRYLYRGMNIGTAKPDEEQLNRVKHYLIDAANIEENWSLAVYKGKALSAFETVWENNKLPFLVGGIGQYIRAIIEGWQIPERKPNSHLRQILKKIAENEGRESLHLKLGIIDLQAATRIDYRNLRRVIRALEVSLTTGKRFSEQRTRGKIDFHYKLIGLIRPREELYQRIDKRIEIMLEEGLIQEVRGLLEKGYSLKNPPLSAIGYREIINFLQGEIELEEAVRLIKRRTRKFVRRQANWFKQNDPRIRWFDMNKGTVQKIIEYIKSPGGWQNE